VSYDRQQRRTTRRDDDWVPPPWDPPANRADQDYPVWKPEPITDRQTDFDGSSTFRRSSQQQSEPERPHESGYVLGLATAPALVGGLAIMASRLSVLSGGGSVPRGLLLLVVVQVFAAGLLRATEHGVLMRSWISTLIVSGVLVPLLALQVTLLREPYVSWERGSASPALVSTMVVAVVLLVGAVWAVASSWSQPDVAGLLFMPQGMIVPAFIGMRSAIQEQPAIEMLGYILLIAAATTAVAWVLPPSSRILAPPFALAIEIVLLWLAGYGPWFHETSGDVVRVLYSVVLALAVILTVSVPFAALWVKHGANEIRDARRRSVRTVAQPPPIRGPVLPR
jgi:hypothetical protein